MEHHADFAVPVSRRVTAEAGVGPDDGHGPLRGDVIALGWWVDPDVAADAHHVPAGTSTSSSTPGGHGPTG
jgi:hypothetical protein